MKKLAVILSLVAAAAVMVGGVSAQDDEPGRPLRNRPRIALDLLRDVTRVITDEIGLDPVEVLRELRETDSTLAEIITANGGSVDEVSAGIVAAVTEKVNQAVANGRITQERADELLANLPEMVTSVLNDETPIGGRAARGLIRLNREHALLSAVEDEIGLTPREVIELVRDGNTLGEIVTANGGDMQTVIDAALASVSERLTEAAANGRITRERADEMLARLETLYGDVMNGTLRERIGGFV